MFAAVLTAAARPGLEVVPMFLFDAPQMGSGKTLLAKCVSLLAGGSTASKPWPDNEDERRKQLYAAMKAGRPVVFYDNIDAEFTSGVLCHAITSGMLSGRERGESTDNEFPMRALFLGTGNNVVLGGDLARRCVWVRLAPPNGNAIDREFAFDPAALCAVNRMAMHNGALTLVRAYLQAETPAFKREGRRRLGGFQAWDSLCCEPVLWVHERISPARIG
jgi:hypothetical protein